MKKVKIFVKTSGFNSLVEDEFEVEDSISEDKIEEMARDAAFEFVEWWYKIENN